MASQEGCGRGEREEESEGPTDEGSFESSDKRGTQTHWQSNSFVEQALEDSSMSTSRVQGEAKAYRDQIDSSASVHHPRAEHTRLTQTRARKHAHAIAISVQ